MSNTNNNNNLRLQYAHQQPHYINTNNGTIAQPILHEPPIVYGNSTNIQHYYQPHEQHYIMQQHHYSPPPPQNILYKPSPQMVGYYSQNEMMVRGSPSSISSAGGGSPRTPSPSNRNTHRLPQPKHTIPSSSPPTNSIMVTPLSTPPLPSASINNTEERVKETIARANAVPIEFYQTEFHEYSKNSYHHSQTASKKRKRTVTDDNSSTNFKKFNLSDLNEEKYDDSEERQHNSELRRQVHIQSEQKRRAQIKDGFDVLKSHLPGCANKKMSKAALLTRTVQQLEHMKKMQSVLLAEVERLAEENANLKSRLSTTCQQPAAKIPSTDHQQQKISINNNKVYTY